jgi:hypothetical protein
VAYDSDASGKFDIWLLDLQTKERLQITNHRNHDFYPSFSPDGNYLTYTGFRNNTFNIFLKNLAIPGSMPIQLTQEDSVSAHPVFSEDGSGIFFDSNRSGSSQIYYLDLSNYETFMVSSGGFNASFPRISGNVLLFDCEEQGVEGIRKMLVDQESRAKWVRQEAEKESLSFQKAIDKIQNVVMDSEKELARAREAAEENSTPAETGLRQLELQTFDLSFLDNEVLPDAQPAAENTVTLEKNGLDYSFLESEQALQPELGLPMSSRGEGRLSSEKPSDKGIVTSEAVEKSTGAPKIDPLRAFFAPRLPDYVKATVPASQAVNVPGYSPLSIIFNRNITEAELSGMKSVKIYEGEDGRLINAEVQYSEGLKRLDIVPERPLTEGTAYRIVAGRISYGFQTIGNSPVASSEPGESKENSNTRAISQKEVPAEPFAIEREFPKDRSRGNRENAPVQVRFSSRINPDTIDAGSLTLFADGRIVPGEMVFENDDQSLTLRPYQNLLEATVYEVRVSKKLRDVHGRALDSDGFWRFKTRYLSPFLITEFPGTVLDSSYHEIELQFNRPVSRQSLRSEEFFLQGRNFKYRGAVELSENGRKLSFRSHQRLPDQQEFSFYISPNLRDYDGNLLENGRPLQFVSRFAEDSFDAEGAVARARNYYPETNEVNENPRSFKTIEYFFQKGFIKNRNAKDLSESPERNNRYRVALLIEEAVSNWQRMNKNEQQNLLTIMEEYESELGNLGIDIERFKEPVQVQKRAAGRQRSYDQSFAGRGRAL